jgi:hypothetical protein
MNTKRPAGSAHPTGRLFNSPARCGGSIAYSYVLRCGPVKSLIRGRELSVKKATQSGVGRARVAPDANDQELCGLLGRGSR